MFGNDRQRETAVKKHRKTLDSLLKCKRPTGEQSGGRVIVSSSCDCSCGSRPRTTVSATIRRA